MGFETINVVGAGILGLWQAYQLAKDGFRVRLYEISKTPFRNSSSWLAGAMLVGVFTDGETATIQFFGTFLVH